MASTCRLFIFCLLVSSAANAFSVESINCWPGFVPAPEFDEQVREIRFASQCRAVIVAPSPARYRDDLPTRLVVYATPNGNTIEQTLGCRAAEGLDWHFDFQHAAAQVRACLEMYPDENLVLACVQANIRSWPTWRKKYAESDRLIREILTAISYQIPTSNLSIVLTGHSGGGSFITGHVNSVDSIPSRIKQIAYLDANYSYSTKELHGKKFLDWLDAFPESTHTVLAYDDREIVLNGKKVVSPTGGTYRASHRMLNDFREAVTLSEKQIGEFNSWSGFDGRMRTLIHPNPKNKILHTRLVGEMNGLIHVIAHGYGRTDADSFLTTPRRYSDWVQSEPFEPSDWSTKVLAIPKRRATAPTGTEFAQHWSSASPTQREEAALAELLKGNVPEFIREFAEVTIEGKDTEGVPHTVLLRVSPDYLAIGTDEDFLRIPITPSSGQLVADAYGCILPTRKIVDAIYNQAQVKLEPRPLTEDRESLTTFKQHHQIIQSQFRNFGAKLGSLVAGIKKDVVVSNRLADRPDRVAIYGWHKLDGRPIQPLSTVHVAWYVDYSHGIRLIDQFVEIDGKRMRVDEVLADPKLHTLLSDEGPILMPLYPPALRSTE